MPESLNDTLQLLAESGTPAGRDGCKTRSRLRYHPSMRQWASSESESSSLLHTFGAKSYVFIGGFSLETSPGIGEFPALWTLPKGA